MFGSCCVQSNKKNKFSTYQQLLQSLRASGLESSQLILGYDFSASNRWTGEKTYHCNMHDIQQLSETPYEKITRLMIPLVQQFDEDGNIPCYVFGDTLTKNSKVRPLIQTSSDPFITGMDNVLFAYRQNAPFIQQSGPTTLAPLIREAIRMCQQTKEYHILIVMTDGDITEPDFDGQAIIDASNYALSIVVVGLGDGPFTTLEKFDSKLKRRKFDNFNFFNFQAFKDKLNKTEVAEDIIALEMLQEIPDQFEAIKALGYMR
ncbi:Copine_I [Hexamita inflata]|uniref:Copine_I n=1 Tax=Hexamita inflata TaxID=28002 RepID=A0ABP1GNY0_9EUKA